MPTVALRVENFKSLKTQSERHDIEELLIVKINQDYPTSNTN